MRVLFSFTHLFCFIMGLVLRRRNGTEKDTFFFFFFFFFLCCPVPVQLA